MPVSSRCCRARPRQKRKRLDRQRERHARSQTAVTSLATRLGVEDKLKANADPNAGQVVIMKSSQLGTAQTAVKLLKALSSLLLIAVFALYALAIYLGGRRRLLLGATGASLVFVGLVIAFMRRYLGGVVVDALVKAEANKHPVSVIWAIETRVMRDIAVFLVVFEHLSCSPRSAQARTGLQSLSDGG